MYSYMYWAAATLRRNGEKTPPLVQSAGAFAPYNYNTYSQIQSLAKTGIFTM
jgi:hypothetical protein